MHLYSHLWFSKFLEGLSAWLWALGSPKSLPSSVHVERLALW